MTALRQTAQPFVRPLVRALLTMILLSTGCQRLKTEGTANSKASPAREGSARESRSEAREAWKATPNGNDDVLEPRRNEQPTAPATRAPGSTVAMEEDKAGKPIVRLDLSFKGVTDVDLGSLSGLEQLQEVYLIQTKVTDAGLTPLAACSRLHTLDLAGTQVTDAVMPVLSKLTELKTLGLSNTKVTDAGILKLKTLRNLQLLDVSSCKAVTSAGIQELQKSLPQVKILH
ncbi:MAG TPA: hypothetical protein VK395_30605 [Gemmataceae bacterium]|nr:hypothetical protein [Gemmataceae bacterium]